MIIGGEKSVKLPTLFITRKGELIWIDSKINSLLFLISCSGAKDALQGKKRSENSDEFFVEKKNALVVPPDIDELPVPLDQEKLGEIENRIVKSLK